MPNLTNFTDATNIGGTFAAANQATHNTLGLTIILMAFIILFVNIKSYYDVLSSLSSSLFVCSIIAIIFRYMNVIGDGMFWPIIILMALSVLGSFILGRGNGL